jgi:signal transduction histidine kinase
VRWVRRTGAADKVAVWRAGRTTTSVMDLNPEKYLQPGTTWYAPDPDKADLSQMPRGALDYTQVPFRFGVVTFTVRHVTEKHIATVQALAEALSLGYMRFQDFQRLEQASVNKSQFLRRMSHDLRSPMNAIIGYTRLLRRRTADRLDSREQRNLANIETSSGNLLNLINDILDLSRIEAGRIEVQPRPVDLRQLADECADALESIVRPGVELRRELADVGEVHTDPDRLRQVVMNLLGNATKFTEAGSITLSLGRNGDGAVELTVVDTGIGIPPEDLPHIFDEFHQVERQGGDQSEGTGLGLAIAKKTVELLGGEIGAASTVGEGTTFTVRLPQGSPA